MILIRTNNRRGGLRSAPLPRLGPAILLAVAACAPREEVSAPAAPATGPASARIVPAQTPSPAGPYSLDKAHASLVFTVDHIGFSNYTGQFRDFDATLQFDPANPAAMTVTALIDAASLDIPSPPPGFLDELKSAPWLDAAGHPEMRFQSTSVTLTAPDAARVEGDLTFRGVTAPVVLEVLFNGGYASFPPYDPNARIGFSAKGALNRSAYGVSFGLPTPEQPVGVGDAVTFEIEAEFIGPPSP
ncbi:MAG: YceI family protein [Parvularculaceae bacterium]|nr:YceI family protein [Parvularculaceae bacterium]